MRRLELGRLLDALPKRLALARTNHMPHHDFLEMLLADEVTRRDHEAIQRRSRRASESADKVAAWDDSTEVHYDKQLWAELTSLRLLADAHNVLIMGPVGVGKTFMANALGHIAVRRGHGHTRGGRRVGGATDKLTE
ncbi:MAG TPA: ATP-binding protein [Mycobacterium sp.]|nr:ATP-binding protein [Mycobacterium sp.]HUH68957.1 ATP-binding protein [Mycobacterium sp.]